MYLVYMMISSLLFACGLRTDEGLCDGLRHWNLRGNTSDHPIIIGAGYGTTGTRAVRDYFAKRGLRVAHWRSTKNMGGSEQVKWHKAFREMTALSPRDYSSYNFRHLSSFVDVVLDTPITPLFPFIIRAFPKATVVMTHRNSTDWAKRRASEHPLSPVPLTEFIGSVLDAERYNESNPARKFEIHPHDDNMATTTLSFDLRTIMVKCLVEPTALFEVDYFQKADKAQDALSAAFDRFMSTRREGSKLKDVQ